ncbi:MAG: hypothetical protein MJ212_04835, partial [Alphaproteobacteria bacterium]|nr:hypothetical protein [Alphaproteobacteria bacterium]
RSGMNHVKGRAGLLAGRVFNRFGGHGHKVLNEEGKTIGYESSFNILGHRFSQKVQKDDSGMWIRETDRHISNGAERAFEKKHNAKGKAEQINLKDSDGNNIKDKDGNDIMVDAYQSKHRILGVTQERENMDAFLVDGKVVYRTADGTRQLTVDENGEIETYKTKFTNDEEKAQKHGGRRTVNDGFMKTSNTYNSEGETTGTRTHFANETAKYLINKDGTINTYAMAQMQNGASDRDTADMAIIANVLQTRGQELSQTYSSRRITRGNDGSFTIEQTENDQKSNTPKKTIITAKMVDNVMVLDTKVTDIITDKNGKAHNHITHTVTNGMQFKTETFTQNDNGNYDYKARFGFANHVHADSSASPIDKDGNWHSNINRDQAMAGFTDADFKNHIQGLSGKGQDNIPAFQMQRQLNANAAALGINLAKEYEMLCQNGATAEKPFVISSINGEHELNYIDSQGLLIKKNFDQEGNQTREFRYNPAESTRKMKTFTAEENEIRNTLNELKYSNIDNKINQIFSLYDIDDEPSDSDEFLEKSEQQTEEEEEDTLTEEEKEEEEVLTEEENVQTEEENAQTEK